MTVLFYTWEEFAKHYGYNKLDETISVDDGRSHVRKDDFLRHVPNGPTFVYQTGDGYLYTERTTLPFYTIKEILVE